MPARLPYRETETRGHATSVPFCFCVSFICDTYIVLARNSRVQSSSDLHVTFDELHTSTQKNRRPCKRGSNLVPEQASYLDPPPPC
ncbi:small integral membrane protein 2 [Acomys russatus]|uniref:small integral membrane protein 2 n=1 Tax=Acomys russatus TaxID=60746 RepID=UPI0021E2E5B5|nr:small integral membrane protein 2 [Acomys russatus]